MTHRSQGELGMTMSTNDDCAKRELSAGELDTIAAGFGFSWFRSEANLILNELQLTMGSKYHPPLPGGGPGPIGGPHRV
jgi:hypothetical protein